MSTDKNGPSANKSILYLVGFMGSGKTEVGRCLAGMLGWAFVDLDDEIAKHAGLTIPEIFSRYGEAHFRTLEAQELQRVAGERDLVVAAGGGTFCSATNQELMARTGTTIWLDAPVELLFARCSDKPESRPLFGSKETMARLLERRRPFYAQAQLHIQVAGTTIGDIAHHIIDRLG